MRRSKYSFKNSVSPVSNYESIIIFARGEAESRLTPSLEDRLWMVEAWQSQPRCENGRRRVGKGVG